MLKLYMRIGASRRIRAFVRANPAESRSDSWFLGGVGRLDARRHGLVHLCAGDGSGAARPAAALGHCAPRPARSVTTAACSSRCFWWAGGWRFFGARWATASAGCARSCSRVLCYSVFTFCGALAQNVWMLASFRLLAGHRHRRRVGFGRTCTSPRRGPRTGARAAQATCTRAIISDSSLRLRRTMAIGAHFGWRAMFLIGGLPALLVAWVRHGVKEPERWREKRRQTPFLEPLRAIFSREYRGRTALNSMFLFVSIAGLWAGSAYVPASVTQLATAAGRSALQAAQLASWAGMLLSVGTIIGCFAAAPLAERFGRRAALAVYFALMAASISLGFGYAYYLREHALGWFLACLFALGIGGANFAIYTLWLPEQYPTGCRATAFAFTTSIGRFAAAGVTFLVGAGVEHFHSIGMPIALTSIAFIIGLALIPFGVETKGQPLP